MRRILSYGFAAVVGVCLMHPAHATGATKSAGRAPQPVATSAAEVIDRNVAARGGLQAWRKVKSMMWLGHLERGGTSAGAHIPFVMQLERPNRTRFEIKQQYSQYTRVFDGEHGWKVRPGNTGQPDSKSFSKEEVDYSRDEFAVDGPLIDYKAKGIIANLDGIDLVEGRKAYRLSLKLPSGAPRKVWIDVKTNLEVRYDRPASNPLAPGAPVSMYYGGYMTVAGLKIPSSLVVSGGPNTAAPSVAVKPTEDRLVIDSAFINPKLDTQAFMPPPTPMRRGGKVLIPSDGTPVGAMGRTGP